MAERPSNFDAFMDGQKKPPADLNFDSFMESMKPAAAVPAGVQRAADESNGIRFSVPHPDEVDQQTTTTARMLAEHLTRPAPTIGPLPPPTLLDRIKGVFMGDVRTGDTALGRATGRGVERLDTPQTQAPLIRAEGLVPGDSSLSQGTRGALAGAEEFGTGMITPENMGIMAATGGMGAVAPILSRLVGAGFGLTMLKGAYDQVPEFRKAVDSGDIGGAANLATKIALSAGLGATGIAHAATGKPGSTRSRSAEEPAQGAAGEPTSPLGLHDLNFDSFMAQVRGERSRAEKGVGQDSDGAVSEPKSKPQSKPAAEPLSAISEAPAPIQEPEAPSTTQNAPSNEGEKQAGTEPQKTHNREKEPQHEPTGPENVDSGGAGERPAVHEEAEPSRGPRTGEETEVLIPGEGRSIRSRYELRELSDLKPSHHGVTFNATPDYELQNERDYSKPENQQRVIEQSSEEGFDPRYHLTDNPDLANGPPLINERGSVIGGNSRTMHLQRVYGRKAEGAESYRSLLGARASRFGIDPAQLEGMKEPVLTRVAPDEELESLPGGSKWAVRKTNVAGTAALSPSERAAADAGQLEPEQLTRIAAAIENAGPDGTLNDALTGRTGTDIVNRLIDSGFFSEQERPSLMDGKTGALTQLAKDRISKAMLGKFFRDSDQIQRTPASIRNKLERISAPLAKVAGNANWDLTPDVQQAVDLAEYATAHGLRNLNDATSQTSMFGEAPKFSDRALRVAEMLRDGKPNDVVSAFRKYVNSKEPNMFGESTPEEAFSDAFGDSKPDSRRGGVSAELLTLGAGKFWEEDIAPAIRSAAHGVAATSDDILRTMAPQLRDSAAKRASLSIRERGAEFARRTDQAEYSLRQARRALGRMPIEEQYEFIRRVEEGEEQKAPELNAIAGVLREMLDGRKADVQALGSGKLQRFYENYFPHIWENPKRAAEVFAGIFGRRPLEGGKAFLKKRTHLTFEDGLAAGLKPLSDNPVDLALMKTREMDRYIMAHRVLNDWKAAKLARLIDARDGKAPPGWAKIDDPIGTVYGQSVQQISEFPNEGIYSGLNRVAQALGIEHERGFKNLGHGAIGRAHRATGKIETLHGTKEGTYAHEIGHQIDWMAGSGKKFVLEYPDAAIVQRLRDAGRTLRDKASSKESRASAREDLKSLKDAIADRKEFAKQLRDLADLRDGRKEYIRSREEKMAQLAQMWVEGRDLFQKTAPKVYSKWKEFLNENPKLHALRDIEANANATEISQPYDVGGLVIRGNWYAPEGAARVLNNHLSPGLRTRSGAFRSLLGLNNVLNQFQLGLSAFHLGFTAADTTVSKAALGYQALLRGKPMQAAKYLAQTPTAAFTTLLQGDRILKGWYEDGSQGEAVADIVDKLVKGGGRARMDETYRTHMGQAMQKALGRGNLIGAALRAPFAGTEFLSNLMMNELVPRMKLGAFADLAKFHMESMDPDATSEQVKTAMAQDWDSIENRLGEMTYDNLFWDRTAKDLAMLSVRSVGWNIGTLREVGGGLLDTVKQPLNALQGKPVNLNRISYLLGLLTVHATMSAVYQKLKTGKGPSEPEDYFFPKNGETDEYGRPQRSSLPTYIKDVYHYGTQPLRTVEGKVAPIWSAFAEMIHNRDFYGTEIRHPDDPLVQQLGQLAKHAAGQAVPIGVRNFQRETKLGSSPATRAEQFVGISPAPVALNEGPGERMARDIAGSNAPGEPRTEDQAKRRELRQELSRSLRQGKGVPAEVTRARQSGELSSKDVAEGIRASRLTSAQRSFNPLSINDALRVYAASNGTEKKELRAMLLKKGRAALQNAPAAERSKLQDRLRLAMKN